MKDISALGVKGRLSSPPISPVNGDAYLITNPTGDWAGKENQVAFYIDEWKFIPLMARIPIFMEDEQKNYKPTEQQDGLVWVEYTS